MAAAKLGDTVKVHYTGKLKDGSIFDASEDSEPLEFTIGKGEVIPGFEQAVIGMEPGELKTAEILAVDAYGPHFDELVLEVESAQLPEDLNPEVGQQLQVGQPSGRTITVIVTDVSDSGITLDANHPLAGEDLTFDIRLMEIAGIFL